MLYIAIGMLGATVMPHNLYLHSSIVQSRHYKRTPEGKREAIHMANIDSALALTMALFVNAAILIVAAAVFYRSGHFDVAAIQDAYKLLSPLLGAAGASTLFAIALLACGQNSSITGTLAGQVVMEGFIHLSVSPWLRRLITRSLAIIPTIIVVAVTGEQGTEKLLILSQVILSLQLSFAVVPLVMFTGSRKKMGEFVNAPLAAGAGVVYRGSDRRAECLAAGPDGDGPLIQLSPIPLEVTHDAHANEPGTILLIFLVVNRG